MRAGVAVIGPGMDMSVAVRLAASIPMSILIITDGSACALEDVPMEMKKIVLDPIEFKTTATPPPPKRMEHQPWSKGARHKRKF